MKNKNMDLKKSDGNSTIIQIKIMRNLGRKHRS
jgi:hypothetical protein